MSDQKSIPATSVQQATNRLASIVRRVEQNGRGRNWAGTVEAVENHVRIAHRAIVGDAASTVDVVTRFYAWRDRAIAVGALSAERNDDLRSEARRLFARTVRADDGFTATVRPITAAEAQTHPTATVALVTNGRDKPRLAVEYFGGPTASSDAHDKAHRQIQAHNRKHAERVASRLGQIVDTPETAWSDGLGPFAVCRDREPVDAKRFETIEEADEHRDTMSADPIGDGLEVRGVDRVETETMTVRNPWADPEHETRTVQYASVDRAEDAVYLAQRGDLVTIPKDGYLTPRLFVVLRHRLQHVASDLPPVGGAVDLRECDETGRTEAYGEVTVGAHYVKPWQGSETVAEDARIATTEAYAVEDAAYDAAIDRGEDSMSASRAGHDAYQSATGTDEHPMCDGQGTAISGEIGAGYYQCPGCEACDED
jgi:hypothetical protein